MSATLEKSQGSCIEPVWVLESPVPEGLCRLIRLQGEWVSQGVIHQVTGNAIDLFAKATGDFNPIHLNDQAAMSCGLGLPSRVAHGDWVDCVLPQLISFWSDLEAQLAEGSLALINMGKEFRPRHFVPIGSSIWADARIMECRPMRTGAYLVLESRVYASGNERPVATGSRKLLLLKM